MKLFIPIAALFVLVFIAPFVNLYIRKYSGWLLAILPLLLFGWFISSISAVKDNAVLIESYTWISHIGATLSFRLDGLSLLFALMVTGIGSLILIYAGYYMRSYDKTNRFFGYLVFFMAAMLGLVMSSDFLTLFLFWELTSISSFMLIGFKHEKPEARKAALQALLITGIGGLALLTGFILMSLPYGSFDMDRIFSEPEVYLQSKWFLPSLLLILTGAFTKSAIFPFHFWLPGAMQAPSPVSAYLHSATMVKAGVFLLFRLSPLMQDSQLWFYLLSVFGVVTMFVGSYLAISQSDLKKMLAYTTVSALGTLVLLIGTSTSFALNAAIIFLIVHALYKATLFMMAGNIEKKTGTRDIRELGGLSHFMPVASAITLLAVLSMSGVPPMLGFIGKELIYEAKITAPDAAPFILILGFLANAFTVFVSVRFAWDVFWGATPSFSKQPKEPDLSLLTGPALLVMLSLVLGLFPELFGKSLLEPALKAVAPSAEYVKLKIWHGFNLVLLLSALTLLLGYMLFRYRATVIKFSAAINAKYFSAQFSEGFFNSIDQLLNLAKMKTKAVQHGYHRFYLMTILISTAVLLAVVIFRLPMPLPDLSDIGYIPSFVYVAAFVMIAGGIGTIVATSRLIMFISAGITGFGLTVMFIAFGGVDLSITMIMVETLLVILGAMIVYHLTHYRSISSKVSRLRDGLIALGFGFIIMLLTLHTGSSPELEKVSDYFVANSWPLAHGKNIVNVILVDFRAIDTLGEITVLVLGAVGIYTLLKTKVKT
jgi:multicomponent Na+:H+ antiporter subunit A